MSDKLKEAIAAIRADNKETGRALLVEILEADDTNEQAWLWMTQAIDDKADRIACLERVLEINPDNQHAKQGLKQLGGATLKRLKGKKEPVKAYKSTPFSSLITKVLIGVIALGCVAMLVLSVVLPKPAGKVQPKESTPQSEYAPITGKVWRDVKVYTGQGDDRTVVFEILGGSSDCPSMPSGKGVKVLYPSGREEWKDRDHIVSSGLYVVRRNDPAISRGDWVEFSGC